MANALEPQVRVAMLQSIETIGNRRLGPTPRIAIARFLHQPVKAIGQGRNQGMNFVGADQIGGLSDRDAVLAANHLRQRRHPHLRGRVGLDLVELGRQRF
jgi:hypothetical protein